MKEITGTITADDDVLWTIHECNGGVLVFESGEQAPFVLIPDIGGDGIAAIAVNGEVPGL